MNQSSLPPLPPGVRFVDSSLAPSIIDDPGGDDYVKVITAHYRVHGLNVSIGWTAGLPMGTFRNPNSLTVSFDIDAFANATPEEEVSEFGEAFNGITSSFLRSIPIGHARALMRASHERLSLAEVRERFLPLPERVELDHEYAHVAAAYAALCESGSAHPIQQLKEWTSESGDTWSARLRRARSKGILLGKGASASLAREYWPLVDQSLRALRTSGKGDHGGQ